LERLKRLAKPADFDRVRRLGTSWAGRLLVLLTLANGLDYTRCGFSAGRSVGGAVKRNRAKRLLREAVRLHLRQLRPGWDLVWLARAPMAEARFPEVQASVAGQLKRARLLKGGPGE
jgi:ribonuclease P protein component